MVVGCVLILWSSNSSKAQNGLIPEKYLSIIPGISTRSDIEKLYRPTDPGSHFVDYDTQEISVGVKYSEGPCDSGQSFLSLPEWTVEEVFYHWREEKKTPFGKIILDRKRFAKRQIGDVTVHDYYVNDASGISVVYDRKLKSVDSIRIRLSTKLREKYSCSESFK